jgi:hypothetical protein
VSFFSIADGCGWERRAILTQDSQPIVAAAYLDYWLLAASMIAKMRQILGNGLVHLALCSGVNHVYVQIRTSFDLVSELSFDLNLDLQPPDRIQSQRPIVSALGLKQNHAGLNNQIMKPRDQTAAGTEILYISGEHEFFAHAVLLVPSQR